MSSRQHALVGGSEVLGFCWFDDAEVRAENARREALGLPGRWQETAELRVCGCGVHVEPVEIVEAGPANEFEVDGVRVVHHETDARGVWLTIVTSAETVRLVVTSGSRRMVIVDRESVATPSYVREGGAL